MSFKVLYLHGIGGRDRQAAWLDPLNERLATLGYDRMAPDEVITPNYSSLLDSTWAPTGPLDEPPVTWSTPPTDRQWAEQDRFIERRQALLARLEAYIGGDSGLTSGLPHSFGNAALDSSSFARAKRYTKSQVRRQIWHTVLEHLASHDRLIIIGHSLGSVVAVDLIPHLPSDTQVLGLITVGSPLGYVSAFRRCSDRMKTRDRFPYGRVLAWVNIFDPDDLITGGRGVSGPYPDALDVPVNNADGVVPLFRDHSIGAYAHQTAFAITVGHCLWGTSLPAPIVQRPAPRIPGEWHPLLLKFAYAQQLATVIPDNEPKRQRRLRLAREELARRSVEEATRAAQHVQDQGGSTGLVDTVKNHPSFHDFLDHPSDLLRGIWEDEELVPLVVPLMSAWPLPPFEIETSTGRDRRREAVVRLLNRIRQAQGPASRVSDQEFAEKALKAERLGRSVVESSSPNRWWLILGAAGLALLAATGVGLAVAAPAGLAGAAAITAALSAFGPGGMAGGIATIAALTGTGGALTAGGAVAAANEADEQDRRNRAERHARARTVMAELAISSPLEQVRIVLANLISVVALQEDLGFPSSRRDVRRAITLARARVANEWRTHQEIAPDTKTTKDLEKKVHLMERAINWLAAELEEGPDARSFRKEIEG